MYALNRLSNRVQRADAEIPRLGLYLCYLQPWHGTGYHLLSCGACTITRIQLAVPCKHTEEHPTLKKWSHKLPDIKTVSIKKNRSYFLCPIYHVASVFSSEIFSSEFFFFDHCFFSVPYESSAFESFLFKIFLRLQGYFFSLLVRRNLARTDTTTEVLDFNTKEKKTLSVALRYNAVPVGQ